MKKLFSLFAITSASLFSPINYSSANPAAIKELHHFLHASDEDPLNASLKKRIFIDALIQSYYNNPRIYESHKSALDGRWATYIDEFKLGADRGQNEVYRMLPDPIGSIKESGLIDWEQRKKDYDIEQIEKMGQDYKTVDNIANQVYQVMYDPNGAAYFKKHYTYTHQFEGDAKLPNAVSLDALRQQYPDIASRYDDKNFTPDQKKQLCDGRMTIKEYKEILNLKEADKYTNHIYNKFQFVFNLPSKDNKTISPTNTKTAYEEHKINVAGLNAKLYAGTSFFALVDPQNAERISKAGGAALKIYDATTSMTIVKKLDPTNLGNIANALGIIIGLFGTAPPDLMIEILKSQQKILTQLNQLEIKSDRIQHTVDSLISITQLNHATVMENLSDIKKSLNKIQTLSYESRDYARQIATEKELRDFRKEKVALTDVVQKQVGSAHWKNVMAGFKKPATKNVDAQIYFTDLKKALSHMGDFATAQIEDKTYTTLVDRENITEMTDLDKIKHMSQVNINERFGMLPGMGMWLSQHLNLAGSVSYDENYEGIRADGTELNVPLGNPAIFTHVLNEYIDLALYRPIEYDRNKSVIPDGYIGGFCNDLNRYEDVIQNMRNCVPLSIAVSNFHLKRLQDAKENLVVESAKHLHIAYETYDTATREKSTHVLYGGLNKDDIKNHLSKLADHEIAALGQHIGIFSKEKYRILTSNFLGVATCMELSEEGRKTYHNGTPSVKYGYFINGMQPFSIGAPPPQWALEEFRVNVENRIGKEYENTIYINGEMAGKPELHEMPATDAGTRNRFIEIMATDISYKQALISSQWKEFIAHDSFGLVLNIYRSQLTLQTMIEGGYGPYFNSVDELKEISESLNGLDEVVRFIETQWIDTQNVIARPNVPPLGLPPSRFPTETVEIRNLFDNFYNPNLKPENPVNTYLDKQSSFTYQQTTQKPKSQHKIISIVKPMPVPASIEANPFVQKVGDLEKARHALDFASKHKDMQLPKDCVVRQRGPSPKP